jgi:hypothetical protein
MPSTERARIRQLPIAFDEAAFWDNASLEAALVREAAQPLQLTLTENRSVLLSFCRKNGAVQLRLHRMFLHAPMDVVRAVARGLRRRNRKGDSGVRRFMNENLFRVRRVPREIPPVLTRGTVHDLLEVYDRLNARFFAGSLRVPVTWGRGSGRARRGGLTFGSYDPVLGLIRIHPVLDRRDVPSYFLESVVHHEMLHHHLGGVADRSGRTVYHTRTFRAAEARYPWHRQALTWEKENLPHLLKASHALDRERKARLASARERRAASARRR